MTAGKKMTVKSLAEEFQKLKQEVEELWSLKHKVAKLERKIKKVNFVDENRRWSRRKPNCYGWRKTTTTL